MKKQFKLLSSILAALTVMSASSITFAAPKNNNKVPVYKKALKYGLISAGVTAAAALTAVGAYKIFSPKDKIKTTHEENEAACEEKVIEINSKEDFKQIEKCRNTITKAIVNVETIKLCAFDGCINLKEVDLSNKVKNIEIESFRNCHSLKIISNSSNVEYIAKWAFINCWSLEKVDLPTAKIVCESAFVCCPLLKKINLSNATNLILMAFFGEWFNYEKANSYISSITYKCSSLKELILPKSISCILWEQVDKERDRFSPLCTITT